MFCVEGFVMPEVIEMTKKTATRLVLIARASTDKQENSLQAQTTRAREFCAANGYELIESSDCIEQGISGKHVTSGKRKGPKAALEMIRAGKADGVLALRLDRVGRSLVQIIEFADELNKLSASLVFVEGGEHSNSAMGRAFLQMMGVMAELERNLISERVTEGLAVVKANGPKPGKKEIGRPRTEDAERDAAVLESWSRLGNYNAVAKELDMHSEQVRRIVARQKVSA